MTGVAVFRDVIRYPVFNLEFDLEDDLEHKNKGHIRIQHP